MSLESPYRCSIQCRYIPDDDDDGLGAILSSAEQVVQTSSQHSEELVSEPTKDDTVKTSDDDV